MICRPFNCIFVHMWFEESSLPHVNSSDKKSREVVTDMYRPDIKNFEYSLEDAVNIH